MNQPDPPARVRVTGPPRRRVATRRSARTSEIDSGTVLGEVFMRSLLREQLFLALRVLGAVAVTFGTLPLAFHFVAALSDLTVLGVPVAWWALGVLAYPWIILLAWLYVRRAEANERAFADLLDEAEPHSAERPGG